MGGLQDELQLLKFCGFVVLALQSVGSSEGEEPAPVCANLCTLNSTVHLFKFVSLANLSVTKLSRAMDVPPSWSLLGPTLPPLSLHCPHTPPRTQVFTIYPCYGLGCIAPPPQKKNIGVSKSYSKACEWKRLWK